MTNHDPYTRHDKTRFTIRIDTELLERIKAEAEKNKRSASKEIEYVMEKYIASLPKEDTPPNDP